jgi:hypothetical protein
VSGCGQITRGRAPRVPAGETRTRGNLSSSTTLVFLLPLTAALIEKGLTVRATELGDYALGLALFFLFFRPRCSGRRDMSARCDREVEGRDLAIYETR